MDWQTPAALGIVAVTTAIFLWRGGLRRWLGRSRPDFRKATGCGCTGHGAPPPPSLIISGRRGERPTVTLKSR